MKMKQYIFSWGGGVNSTAILAMIKLGMLPELTKDNTHIVFADTGAEMPYTYEHTSTCLQPMARGG
jgi:3'-phosphoadenosine 5'-phosphosulfate sulfotransferase (PAPS reductase)/FAD synthetase